MDTVTNAPQLARSRRSTRPDPASLWEPLADLTEAAARIATTGVVAITRGFDRTSRQRAKALRDLLDERGISAIEVTAAPGSERLLADAEVATVVNLIGAGSWQPYRLAAKLRAPVLTPRPSAEQEAEVKRDVIGMLGDSGTRDVALSHVAVRPEDSPQNAEASNVTITVDGTEQSVPGGWVAIGLRDQALEVRFGGAETAEQTLTAQQVRIATSETPHRLVRDELPIAEFDGAITFTAEARGLTVQPV